MLDLNLSTLVEKIIDQRRQMTILLYFFINRQIMVTEFRELIVKQIQSVFNSGVIKY